jgi:hypothetical protein
MLETGEDWIDHATSRSPEQEKMWNTTIDTSANISEAEQPRFLSTFRPVAENSAMQPMAEAATLTSVFGWLVSWISSVVILYLCNSASLNSVL